MSILTLTGVSKSFGGQKVLDGLTMAVSEERSRYAENLSDSGRARKASRSATCPMCQNSTLI